VSSGGHPTPELADDFDDLLSSVAHDLRTPISVIVGYAELMRMRDNPDVRREAIERIEEAGQRLYALIEELFLGATIAVEDGVPVLRVPLAAGGSRS
jgi:signal transduction histidine kinase